MSEVLKQYFNNVQSSDIAHYSYSDSSLQNFLTMEEDKEFDWVITNPPFKLAEDFIQKSLKIATIGVAMLVRTVFIESIGRYERLFTRSKPTSFSQYAERVPMLKGRLDRSASTATGYGWIVWNKQMKNNNTELRWIPPLRKKLEKDEDYIIKPK